MQIETQALDRQNLAAAEERTRNAWRALLANEDTRRALRQIRDGDYDHGGGGCEMQAVDRVRESGALTEAGANFANGRASVWSWIERQLRRFDFEGFQRFEAEYQRERAQRDEDERRVARQSRAAEPPPEVAPKDLKPL